MARYLARIEADHLTGKAAQVGPDAGMTRKLTGTVKIWEDPPTYIYDTPGVMIPYFGEGDEAAEKGLKLALTCRLILDALGLKDIQTDDTGCSGSEGYPVRSFDIGRLSIIPPQPEILPPFVPHSFFRSTQVSLHESISCLPDNFVTQLPFCSRMCLICPQTIFSLSSKLLAPALEPFAPAA